MYHMFFSLACGARKVNIQTGLHKKQRLWACTLCVLTCLYSFVVFSSVREYLKELLDEAFQDWSSTSADLLHKHDTFLESLTSAVQPQRTYHMEKPCFRYTQAKWKAQKNEFRYFHLDKLKNNEFNHWISFSRYGSGPGMGLVFWVIILCRVRVLGQLGRVDPNFGLTEQSLTLPSRLREAFFWFPSTQGRQNGRAGGRQKWNRKETQRRRVQKITKPNPNT